MCIHIVTVHVSRNVKEMGEVSRIRTDRTNSSKYPKNQSNSTIERFFGDWPTLINTETRKVNNIGLNKFAEEDKEEEIVINERKNHQYQTKSSENDGIDDIRPISFRHTDEGPLSKKPPKFHQKHVPCTVLEQSCSNRSETVTATTETEASAEDSSYDSDNDSISSTYSNQLDVTKQMSISHKDVSRTVSDTLAAEFADYVTLQSHQQATVYSQKSTGYIARVEFALKLGYTERLVQAALQKLGPEPGQDELLAELIKLGASGVKFPDSTEDSAGYYDSETVTEDTTLTMTVSTGVLLRPVVIDGSNVAMSHGNKELFSCRGIKICVDWFRARGHKEITVFVPKWRKESSRPDNPIVDQEILGELERDRLLVFTPSRLVNGKRLVCYDDRYILRLAVELDGIVVSNDNYRDLAQENPEFRRIVEERILMFSFVNDRFMPPDDPLGRGGPTLDNFLKISPRRIANLPCPYAKKCTYGNKCKFLHPERGEIPQKTVTEQLVEHAQRHLRARGPSLSLPLPTVAAATTSNHHRPLCRTQSAVLPQSTKCIASSKSMDNEVNNIAAATSYNQPTNMHKKLQRQLTLNPNCDLRLYHLKRQHYYQQLPTMDSLSGCRGNIQHRPLINDSNNNRNNPKDSNSNESQLGPVDYQSHKHVTRIASAPDSSLGWPPPPVLSVPSSAALPSPNRQRLGMSDPQLNLLPYPTAQDTQIYDARRRLHYHLANIFPCEHVQVAMALHPHETDPQHICAAILAMFPKPR